MTLTSLFKAIADAIRAKTGSSAGIKAEDFPSAIAGISSGTDTSDATAAAADVRSPKTFYAGGEKKTGSMADVSVPTPGISYSSSGVVSASVSQSAGYTPGGSKSNSYSLPTVGGQTITPGSARQTISGGKFLTGDIVVEAVSGGAEIVYGEFTGDGSRTITLDTDIEPTRYVIWCDVDTGLLSVKGTKTLYKLKSAVNIGLVASMNATRRSDDNKLAASDAEAPDLGNGTTISLGTWITAPGATYFWAAWKEE